MNRIGRDEAASSQPLCAADLHVHTSCSPDVLPAPGLEPLALYRRGLERGLDFITFTDHDTVAAYDRLGWERERLVTGVELSIRDRRRVGHTIHVNVYQFNRRQFTEMRELAAGAADLERLLAYFRENRLPFIYNHPFGFTAGERPSARVVADLIALFPVVEYNMHRVRRKNRLARKLADRAGRGMVSASDTHTGNIGAALTLAAGPDFRAYYDRIARGEASLVRADLSVRLLRDEMGAWLEMFFGLDPLRPGQVCSSGTRIVEYFVRVFSSDLFERPGWRRFSRRACSLLTRTGAPAAVYLGAQDLLARRLERFPGLWEPAEQVP